MGEDFTRCKVLGILDIKSAMQVNDVVGMAIAIYPSLPQGTNKDYKQYQYVKLRLNGGGEICVANEWIKPQTIKTIEDITATFTVSGISASDVDAIARILTAYNYTNFTTKVT